MSEEPIKVTDTVEVSGVRYSFIRPYFKACHLCVAGMEFEDASVCVACGEDGFCVKREDIKNDLVMS